MRKVFQDAIEDLRASLVFNNAFPDGILTISFIRLSLNTAAQNNCPAASSIQRRLLHDEDYVLKITPVVSFSSVEDYKADTYSKLRARIPHFRSEVKDRCNTIALGEFVPMAPVDIVRTVEWQRSNYNYTYPKGPRVSNSCSVVTI